MTLTKGAEVHFLSTIEIYIERKTTPKVLDIHWTSETVIVIKLSDFIQKFCGFG